MDATHQVYLLVYHSYPQLPGERWLDQSNDPELRVTPMTWGICRPDVRAWARADADLFFLAYLDDGSRLPANERYYLTARFRVAERISQDEAVQRFHGRPNVILDLLPDGPSLADRLRTYVADHLNVLAWDDVAELRHDLATGAGRLFDRPGDFTHTIDNVTYVHAWWDDHPNWQHRSESPYLVADEVQSKVLESAIPYAQCVAECPALPSPEDLQAAGGGRHNPRRLREEAAIAYLVGRVVAAPARDLPHGAPPAAALSPVSMSASPCAPSSVRAPRRKVCAHPTAIRRRLTVSRRQARKICG